MHLLISKMFCRTGPKFPGYIGLFFLVEMVWWTKISVGNFSPRTSSSRIKTPVTIRLALNRDNICAQKLAKYALGEPKLDVKNIMYVKEILSHLLADAETRSLVSDSFTKII